MYKEVTYFNGSLEGDGAEASGCVWVLWYIAEVQGCVWFLGYVAEVQSCGSFYVMLLKLPEHFLYYVHQHALAPLRRSGTKLEKTSLSAGVFRGHAEHNIGTAPVNVVKIPIKLRKLWAGRKNRYKISYLISKTEN